ncbi:hypothetical protein Tco_0647103 [Tanacetum coccineum]
MQAARSTEEITLTLKCKPMEIPIQRKKVYCLKFRLWNGVVLLANGGKLNAKEPLEIVGREVKWLKRSRIPLVKVRWNSKRGPSFTWDNVKRQIQ